ncbi:protocadherin Fat 4 [Melanotaenia boesemani]|uniref:protocadherin Fat 4 n=1 Tax=Melanotaenia boesemani TaxID=1250792 RepID=UPI001C04E4E1|nr:protocadherin Fat 4 [Melanotaenia boesemani]
MDPCRWIQIYLLLLVSLCLDFNSASPIHTSTINCNTVTPTVHVGTVDEGYAGDVEVINGIAAGTNVKLVSHIFPVHLEFLELSFALGDTSATVRTKKPLDADALTSSDSTLYYSVMCDTEIKFNNTRTLKINDLNDNGPVFTKDLYSVDVSETQSVNTEVLRVTAEDADSTPENNRVSYSIVPETDDFLLTGSGAFILQKPLNYNVVQKYNFIVTGQDSGGLNDTASVEITVVDFDNLNPYFHHSLYQAFIPENQAGLFQSIQPEPIKAQDGDTGINIPVTYSIGAVSPDMYERNFEIDSSSGVLSVTKAIDREMSSGLISINIKAAQTDDSLKTADAVVTVTVEDVNDNAPEFDQTNYTVTLPENSPADTFLFKAAVTDRDQGGFVGTLRILPESAPFTISPDGTVRVKNSSALDREAAETIVFQIEARENDPPNHDVRAQVTVSLLDENDNSPTFTSSSYDGKVYVNQTVGMLVVQVKAEDPDAGVNGRIKYSIDFGNSEGYFSLSEDTGDITLAKTIPLVENRVLEFPLHVTAKDGGVLYRSSSVQVIIRAPGDSKPHFLHEVYQGTVEEEQDPGVFILRADFSTTGEVPVTLQVQTEADKFSISPNGEFTTKQKLDYDDGPHNYSVEISVSDGSTTNTAVVKLHVTDINDNSPVFTSTSVTKSVPEDSEVGSNVTVVPATDKDSDFNKELRYSLRGGEGRFSVDPVSGMVSVAGTLDRETTASYSLLVVAEDQGRPARSATATLTVQVADINDNVPKFSEAAYQVEVLETESLGETLVTVSAEDPDEGANGRIMYTILLQSPPSEPAVFTLDASSGALKLAQPLDYSEVKAYTLKVQASDGGAPSLVGNGSVVVKVKDVNNNPPEFSKDSYDVAVTENLASGASILTLEVTDRDEDGFSNGHFLYTSDTFDINNQGVVSLRKGVSLDRETQDSYIFQVIAVDQPTDGLRASAQLNISILDYNDNAPQFPSIPDPLEISEGDYSEKKPGEVFTIRPTDADTGLNGEVSLSLSSPHPLFRFREDGMLLAVGPLDRENRETYELVVKASDKGSPMRENITFIRVSLIDVNDNRPEFSSSSYVSGILLKDAEEGKLVLTLSASDKDIGNNSLITYSFSAGNSPYLALNSETGAVTLTSAVADITENTMLALTAMATDHGHPPLNSTVPVEVSLRTVSLVEGVAFQSSSYNFSLPENQPAGATVGQVLASSGSTIYEVSYRLKTNTELFSISSDGAIQTTAQLDKEQQEWFILDVEAVDTRTPPSSALAMVRVQVEDVNEPPQFPPEVHKATVFSIAPYKTPVIYIKASDPDVGDENQLVYSLSDESSAFDVDPASGLVYVVSATGLAGQTAALEVKATDPRGLFAKAKVEVVVRGSASSSDVAIISLNQPANVVEKKVPELEASLGKVLGWTVNVIQVSSVSGGAVESRSLRESVRTLVSFVALDGEEVVPSNEVTKKLQSQSDAVKAELALVFGEGLHFDIETTPQSPSSNQAAVIALGVLLTLSILGLMVALAMIIRFKRKKKHQDSDKERLDITRHGESYTNQVSGTSEQGQTNSKEKTDRAAAQWKRRTDEDGAGKTDGLKLKEDTDESHTSF